MNKLIINSKHNFVVGNMKILVTGAKGFLGKYAVKELQSAGHSIEEFDLESGNNILDAAQVENACRGKDAVVHLAAGLDEALPYKKLHEIYVKDAASAIKFVLGNENAENENYIVAEERAGTLEEVYGEIANLLNVEIPKKHLPVWRAKLLAHMLLVKAKMQGKKTIIMPAHIDRLVRTRSYNTGKINKLG